MKTLMTLFLACVPFLGQPDLTKIRAEYPNAAKNEKKARHFYKSLSSVTKKDDKVLVAYKGAASTIMAQYVKGIGDKTSAFKEGRELLEYAVKEEPSNIEIRCVRLSVQEHAPKVVNYRDNIEEDKTFILTNYKHTRSKAVKEFVKNYALQSDAFDESEKQTF